MRSSLEPLRLRPFRRLLISYTLNEIGDAMGLVALALLVYQETGSALATTGLFLALNVLPAIASPALIARVDQIAIRRALPALYVAEALIFVGLAFLADAFFLPLVLLLGLIDGTLALTGRGLTRAALGTLLQPRSLLRQGNGLFNVAFALGGVGGTAVSGLICAKYGVATALMIDAASFALAALCIGITSGLRETVRPDARQPALKRMREGLAYVRDNQLQRLLLFGEAVALVLFTMVVPIEVIYAQETLDTDEAGFGLLLASWSAGMVVGSLIFIAARQAPVWRLVLVSTAVIGAAYIGMASVDELAVACAFSVLGGAGNGIQWVAVVTALQQSTPADLHARVVGLLESVNRAAPAVGFVIGGVLTALFEPPVAFGVAGTAILVLVLAAIAFRPGMPRGAPVIQHPTPVTPSGSAPSTLTFVGTALLVGLALANALRPGRRRR